MFEKASRQKLRFDTPKGQLSVEDLWDLPLHGLTGKANLDDIARVLDAELKAGTSKSFVNKATSADEVLKLKFDIVIHVINTRLDEREAANKIAEKREQKQKIMAIIEQKKDAALSEASLADLEQMLAGM